jgi:glycine dehydrogenase subunit 1
MGPQGLRETATLCLQKSNYARRRLTEATGLTPAFAAPTFKEFVLRDTTGRVSELLEEASVAGYLAGVPLGRWYPDLADCFLVTVTEKRTKAEIDGLANQFARSFSPASVLHA